MRHRLTPAFAAKAAAASGAARTTYWGAAMPGFGLMVTANGHRSYVVQYRAAGRSRRMHLKQGLTLRAARKETKGILGAVAKCADPLSERRKAQRSRCGHRRGIPQPRGQPAAYHWPAPRRP